MMIKIKKQSGLTLIEMIIAMLLGLLVTGSIIAIFISNVKSSSENIKMIHLNQELRTVMGFMSDELKRAGYSADPSIILFTKDFSYNSASNNCLRYSYDVDGDGAQDPNERFGFKLITNSIQWSSNVTTTNCSNGTWQSLTDPDTAKITELTITPDPYSSILAGTIHINKMNIKLTGEVALNPGVASRTITETIRVRNEDAS